VSLPLFVQNEVDAGSSFAAPRPQTLRNAGIRFEIAPANERRK
jgi:hypothetical protein